LAQQYGGPVAGLGAACAGLDVDEAVVRVGRVGEHAAEFKRFDALSTFSMSEAMLSRLSSSFSACAISNSSAHRRDPARSATGRAQSFRALYARGQVLARACVFPDGGVFGDLRDFG